MVAKFFLVTGGTGYIAIHVINQLLQQGFRVRTTVRDPNDSHKVEPIKKLALNSKYPIEIVKADLLDANVWKSVVKDVTHVLHVASPLLVKEPSDETEAENLIMKPAIEGTLNVLNACLNTSVERVVMTSSGLAVFGQGYKNKTYSEADWPEYDKLKTHYSRSKFKAEKAAWNFYSEQLKIGKCFEFAVVNPVLVLGPVLNYSSGTSVTRFSSILENKIEKIPNLYYAVCDVRDVAAAHIKASLEPNAVGNRHLIVSHDRPMPQKLWADILREEFSSKGFKIPSEINQDDVAQGENTRIDLTRMKNVLCITPTDFKKTVIDMANSLIEFNLVKKPE